MQIHTPLRRLLISLFVFLPALVFAQASKVPESIIKLHDEVMDYVGKNKTNQKFDPPPPPSTYFDYCFPCDEERQKIFVRDSINFMEGCMGEELTYMKKADRVMEHFANRRVMKNPFDSSAFLKMSKNMFRAKIVIAGRMQQKLAAAWKKYYNDPEKVPFLVNRMTEQYRINALLGLKSESTMPSENLLPQFFIIAAARTLSKATAERDYPLLLNIDWILGLFRYAERQSLDASNYGIKLSDYANSNLFEFSVETKVKVNVEDGGSCGASFTSKSIFMAKPDTHCHLRWTQVDPKSSQFYYHLENASAVTADGKKPQYVGTTQFESPHPQIKLDFCDDKRDTAHFYGFSIKSLMQEKWTYNGQTIPGTGGFSLIMVSYLVAFPDARGQYEEFVKGAPHPVGSAPFGFLVKAQPKNKQKVILDKALDAKENNEQADKLEYGEFKLKIEHVEN